MKTPGSGRRLYPQHQTELYGSAIRTWADAVEKGSSASHTSSRRANLTRLRESRRFATCIRGTPAMTIAGVPARFLMSQCCLGVYDLPNRELSQYAVGVSRSAPWCRGDSMKRREFMTL